MKIYGNTTCGEEEEGGYKEVKTHPVANIMTSASTVLPSSNSNPVFVKRLMGVPLCSLIFPSISICDAPTSALCASAGTHTDARMARCQRRTEVVPSSTPLGHREEARAVRPEVRPEADLVQVLDELPAPTP